MNRAVLRIVSKRQLGSRALVKACTGAALRRAVLTALCPADTNSAESSLAFARCFETLLDRRSNGWSSVAHQFAQRLIVGVNAPFGNLSVLHDGAPGSRDFPETISARGRSR